MKSHTTEDHCLHKCKQHISIFLVSSTLFVVWEGEQPALEPHRKGRARIATAPLAVPCREVGDMATLLWDQWYTLLKDND